MAADFFAGRGLVRVGDNRQGTVGRRVGDVDGQEAALVAMSVEQQQMLVAVDKVARNVDSRSHGRYIKLHTSVHSNGRSDEDRILSNILYYMFGICAILLMRTQFVQLCLRLWILMSNNKRRDRKQNGHAAKVEKNVTRYRLEHLS